MAGHLIHVGYPKTGSTFLEDWFATHPQVAYVRHGIAGYAGSFDIARAAAAPDPAIRLRVTRELELTLPDRQAGHRGLRAFAYGDDPEAAQQRACALLADLCPNAHILITTRGRRSLRLSAYSEYVRMGGTMSLGGPGGVSGTARYGWNLDSVVAAYEAAFPGRVIVLPYELLRDDADAFARVLEERFGLDHHAPEPQRVNASLSPVELRWYPRLSRLVIALPLPGRLRRRVVDGYVRLVLDNRLARLIAVLQRVAPAAPVTAEGLPEDPPGAQRHQAETLRGRPHYAAYAGDYRL